VPTPCRLVSIIPVVVRYFPAQQNNIQTELLHVAAEGMQTADTQTAVGSAPALNRAALALQQLEEMRRVRFTAFPFCQMPCVCAVVASMFTLTPYTQQPQLAGWLV
jgi:hypothetical protein